MKRLIYAERSLLDLEGILEFIARDNPDAAIRFAEGLIAACELLATNTELGEQREDVGSGIRLIAHHRYAIYYRVDEDAVRIQRFLHGSRDASRQLFD